MVTNRVKKTRKYYGHVTHGGGSRKKRRGAGSRGGRGRAGSGKRASHKVAGGMIISGKNGFTRVKPPRVNKVVNVGDFTESFVNKLISKEKATKSGDSYSIDLDKAGYTKLLSTGTTTLKLKLNISQFSNRAEEKIKEAGGEIVSPVVDKKADGEVKEEVSEKPAESAEEAKDSEEESEAN